MAGGGGVLPAGGNFARAEGAPSPPAPVALFSFSPVERPQPQMVRRGGFSYPTAKADVPATGSTVYRQSNGTASDRTIIHSGHEGGAGGNGRAGSSAVRSHTDPADPAYYRRPPPDRTTGRRPAYPPHFIPATHPQRTVSFPPYAIWGPRRPIWPCSPLRPAGDRSTSLSVRHHKPRSHGASIMAASPTAKAAARSKAWSTSRRLRAPSPGAPSMRDRRPRLPTDGSGGGDTYGAPPPQSLSGSHTLAPPSATHPFRPGPPIPAPPMTSSRTHRINRWSACLGGGGRLLRERSPLHWRQVGSLPSSVQGLEHTLSPARVSFLSGFSGLCAPHAVSHLEGPASAFVDTMRSCVREELLLHPDLRAD